MKIIIFAFLAFIFVSCSSRPARIDETFTVDLRSPQEELGSIDLQLERAFPRSGLRRVDVTVSYFPEEDAVCLFYRSEFFSYHQFWSAEGREIFLRALAQYEAALAERNLPENNRRTKNIYGEVEGFLSWQQFAFTVRVQANMMKEFGYAWVSLDNNRRAPYFTVTQKQAIHENPIDHNDVRTSQEITMFFTRAQAQALAVYFDPVFLQDFAVERRPRGWEFDIDFDDYDNFGVHEDENDEDEDETEENINFDEY